MSEVRFYSAERYEQKEIPCFNWKKEKDELITRPFLKESILGEFNFIFETQRGLLSDAHLNLLR